MIVNEEFAKAGVPTGGPNDGFGIGMIGPTLIVGHRGPEAPLPAPHPLRRGPLVPGLLRARRRLATWPTLGTRAVLDGDEWVINGQKIWTSDGHTANWIFVLCRTDPDAPKHQGITFLLVPDGPARHRGPADRQHRRRRHEFNEVFFTDARTAKENVVGEVDDGWAVTNTLLGFERGAAPTAVASPSGRSSTGCSRSPASGAAPATR